MAKVVVLMKWKSQACLGETFPLGICCPFLPGVQDVKHTCQSESNLHEQPGKARLRLEAEMFS